MHSIEKLCRLCADDLDVSISLESLGDLVEIQKIVNFVSKKIYFVLLSFIESIVLAIEQQPEHLHQLLLSAKQSAKVFRALQQSSKVSALFT